MEPRLQIEPVPWATVASLSEDLGVSTAFAQVLARRGLRDAGAARAFLDAGPRHDPALMGDIAAATQVILDHVARGERITVHGDYDCDGVCATAILVGGLRAMGADVDWFIPGRIEDGYGLRAATVARLAERGTRLLVTVDCGITAVDEVAAARAAGMAVVVTDHHRPRADGALPDCPIVHPGLGDYPCPHLCGTAVAHQLHVALRRAAGADPAGAGADLDLVALATVADCVDLVDENRRLVRDGLVVLAAARRPGTRALLRAGGVDPGAVDARTLAFRLAPRLNAAGRVQRADAGVELLLTDDADRAASIAAELNDANAERRHVETRIRFEAEAMVREAGEQPAYVLAGEGWHPGVIGIVASRIAERHHRPVLVIALDGGTGTGSGRSIEGFDLLAGLEACSQDLLRHGGHRAAAGFAIAADRVDALRTAFTAHAAAALTADQLVPTEHVDAVVGGDELGMALCDELAALEPVGSGNPEPVLLVPGARLTDARTMGEGKHLRFVVRSGGRRAGAVAFGRSSLPPDAADGMDATFTLERNEFRGTVEPRLRLREVLTPRPGPITLLPTPPPSPAAAAFGLLQAAEPAPPLSPAGARAVHDRREGGAAGLIGALVATGEPVLVVGADAAARFAQIAPRIGGFALTDHDALERDPALADPYVHVVALDPPAGAAQEAALRAGRTDGVAHLAWGSAQLPFAQDVLHARYDLRPALAALFRALREHGPADAAALDALLPAGSRDPAGAARLLRVLSELGLADVDPAAGLVTVRADAPRTDLDRSPTARDAAEHLAQATAWLSRARPIAA